MFDGPIHGAIEDGCSKACQDGHRQAKDLHGPLLTLEKVKPGCHNIEKGVKNRSPPQREQQRQQRHQAPKDRLSSPLENEGQRGKNEREDAGIDHT